MPPDGLETARITITRTLHDEYGDDRDDRITTEVDPPGMSLVETLGLLRFAEDSVIRNAMGEGEDDDE